MMENKILPEQQSDHLFLLVGANPLPVWVAARLLLRPGGRLYLIHSAETQKISRRLARRFIADGFSQPVYVSVGDLSRPAYVFDKVAGHVQTIEAGSIGLNYTGGTKLMAVQAYRAIEQARPRGVGDPVFSYLDAKSLEMRFDDVPPYLVPVGLLPEVSLSLEEIFALHDDSTPLTKIKRQPIALPLAQAIAELHGAEAGYKAWRQGIMKLQPVPKRELDKLTLDNDKFAVLRPIADILTDGRPLAQTTLRELCREKVWPFSNPKQFVSWFEGLWLESYVLDVLQQNQAAYQLNDIAGNLVCQFKKYKIEADVAAMRGYQLHFVSCYTGHSTASSKFKLIEGIVRARQIGGDEAGAALVCMSDTPQAIEANMAQAWRKERVKVFGRHDLPRLEEKFGDWFR